MSKKLPDILPPCDRIIVIGDLHGDWKIIKEIFLKAFNQSGVTSPNRMIHVGDSLELDFKPAKECGFKSILMIGNKECDINVNEHAQDLFELENKILKI